MLKESCIPTEREREGESYQKKKVSYPPDPQPLK